MTRKLFILVEGQTEETFVRDVLATHLDAYGLAAVPVVLKTKRLVSGGHFRGGVTSASQVLGDVHRLLRDTSAVAVTTMLDYYRLPENFSGMASRPAGSAHARVCHVEGAFGQAFSNPRFIPHIVLHEYEAWLFVEPEKAHGVFTDDVRVAAQLRAMAVTAGGAELVDEGPETAPSKRLLKLVPGYRKTLHGPQAVGAIGLAAIRAHCPHAADWLTRLEQL